MKKVLLLSVVMLCFASNVKVLSEGTTNVELKKESQGGGMRVPGPNPTSFSAQISGDIMYLMINNYTGILLVEIIGVNGFTTNFTMSGSGSTSIDISALNTGIYTLRITTSTSIYTGQFVL